MCRAVGKSGSPISRWITGVPPASRALARASTSNADSVPSLPIRSASRKVVMPSMIGFARFAVEGGTLRRLRGSCPECQAVTAAAVPYSRTARAELPSAGTRIYRDGCGLRRRRRGRSPMRGTTRRNHGAVITKHASNTSAGPAYRLSSVDHALELLMLFRSRPSLRVSEVAEELNVARSTAHRLLGMLVYWQFAVQDPATRAYRPGPRLVEIGLAAVGALDMRTRMRPYLTDVAARTGETVSLLVLEGDTVHFIDSIESQRTVRVGSRFDSRMPAHATSAGKAMLAALPVDEVLAIYPNEKLTTVTGRTLATRTQLLASLARVRLAGFAIALEEGEIGLGAVGMAVLDADGRPAAAFTAAGPMQRMTPGYVRALAVALHDSVAAATAELLQLRNY